MERLGDLLKKAVEEGSRQHREDIKKHQEQKASKKSYNGASNEQLQDQDQSKGKIKQLFRRWKQKFGK